MINVQDLTKAFAAITTHWDPHIVGELNGQLVKCAKLKGEFVWHQHDEEDELFLVHKGTLLIRLRDRELLLNTGQFCIIPRGVEHQPYAEEEVEVVLFEPDSTVNTGATRCELTRATLKRLDV